MPGYRIELAILLAPHFSSDTFWMGKSLGIFKLQWQCQGTVQNETRGNPQGYEHRLFAHSLLQSLYSLRVNIPDSFYVKEKKDKYSTYWICCPLFKRWGESVLLLSLPSSRLPSGLGINVSGKQCVDFATVQGAAHRTAAGEPIRTKC